MAKIKAGELIDITIDGQQLTVKIEDASKSEYLLAKVQESSVSDYQVGNVYQFDRGLFKGD